MKIFANRCEKEKGFTLIELLTAMSIVSVLLGLGASAFFIYQKDAHYTRAVSDLGNAQRAASVGLIDFPYGINVGLVFTGIAGGPVPGALNQAMPGATTSPDIKLGAQFSVCAAEDFTPQVTLISQPCLGDKYITYMKFCNNVEIRTPKIARNYVCP